MQALANNPDRGKIFSTQSLPFEFSRDSCGAPHLGYVHSRHFGYPVQSVTKDANGGGTVTMTSNWSPVWPMKTKPVLLASAVAASGAALDSNMSGKVKVSPLTWPQGSTQTTAVKAYQRVPVEFDSEAPECQPALPEPELCHGVTTIQSRVWSAAGQDSGPPARGPAGPFLFLDLL